MNCTSCGVLLAPGQQFCPDCGAGAAQDTASQGWGTPPNDAQDNGAQNQSQGAWGEPQQPQQGAWGDVQQPQGAWGQGPTMGVPPPNQHMHMQQQQGRMTAAHIIAGISAALVGISWFLPLGIDLIFSVPAFLIAIVAVVVAFIGRAKRRREMALNQDPNQVMRMRSDDLISAFGALAASVISSIIFIVWIMML